MVNGVEHRCVGVFLAPTRCLQHVQHGPDSYLRERVFGQRVLSAPLSGFEDGMRIAPLAPIATPLLNLALIFRALLLLIVVLYLQHVGTWVCCESEWRRRKQNGNEDLGCP